MTTTKKKSSKIIYTLNADDLQTVADDVLDRSLTKKEVALLEKSIEKHINWFQAIENAIHENIQH